MFYQDLNKRLFWIMWVASKLKLLSFCGILSFCGKTLWQLWIVLLLRVEPRAICFRRQKDQDRLITANLLLLDICLSIWISSTHQAFHWKYWSFHHLYRQCDHKRKSEYYDPSARIDFRPIQSMRCRNGDAQNTNCFRYSGIQNTLKEQILYPLSHSNTY